MKNLLMGLLAIILFYTLFFKLLTTTQTCEYRRLAEGACTPNYITVSVGTAFVFQVFDFRITEHRDETCPTHTRLAGQLCYLLYPN